MSETMELNGITYKMEKEPEKIILQRYNEQHKMNVSLHFPTGNHTEKKRTEENIIQILSNQYIARNAQTQGNGCDLHLLPPED